MRGVFSCSERAQLSIAYDAGLALELVWMWDKREKSLSLMGIESQPSSLWLSTLRIYL
jgi:hypothetical protein